MKGQCVCVLEGEDFYAYVSGCQLRDTCLFSTGLRLGLGPEGVGVRHPCRPVHLSSGQFRTLQEASQTIGFRREAGLSFYRRPSLAFG